MKREPFTSTLRPLTSATSASGESKWRAPSPKARTASRVASPSASKRLTPFSRAYAPTSRWNSGPFEPTSPMSPSTSTVGAGQDARTSMAARTESGFAL
jgi:hypothetical protein